MESILAGEHAENEFRKSLTPSERAAIGKAIEEELGKRQGQRTDKPANAGKLPKGESIDIAAKKAGFKSAETFERAKTVVDRGAPELQQAMDQGKVSVAAASVIASQPKDEQKRIVEIGQCLIEVKERIGHGIFLAWLAVQIQWSEQAARNFMNVAKQFKSTNFGDLQIDISALYLLAKPSTARAGSRGHHRACDRRPGPEPARRLNLLAGPPE